MRLGRTEGLLRGVLEEEAEDILLLAHTHSYAVELLDRLRRMDPSLVLVAANRLERPDGRWIEARSADEPAARVLGPQVRVFTDHSVPEVAR